MKKTFTIAKTTIADQTEGLDKTLNIGSILLPIFLTIVLVKQLLQDELVTAVLVFAGILFSLIIRVIFLRGHIKKFILVIIVFFTLLLTLICTAGNGIHDLGIIAFPIVIGFSSIILVRRKLIIASVLSMASMIWLVVGDHYDLFVPLVTPKGNIGDFIVAITIILLGAYVAFSVTMNMKNSLHQAQKDIRARKREADKLSKEVKEKTQIIYEIHQKVINSMNYIQKLIAIQQKLSKNDSTEYLNLQRKIIVIETAHGNLLTSGDSEKVSLNTFTTSLVNKYLDSIGQPKNTVILNIKNTIIALDDAIYYGICLLELLHLAIEGIKQPITIEAHGEHEIVVTVVGFESNQDIGSSPSGLLLDLITRQLKGSLKHHHEEELESFELNFKPSSIL